MLSPRSRPIILLSATMESFAFSATGEAVCLREREQLSHDFGAALGRVANRDEVVAQRVACAAVERQLREADDDGEDVVEVVGDPASQPSDGVHLLRLNELGLQLLAL